MVLHTPLKHTNYHVLNNQPFHMVNIPSLHIALNIWIAPMFCLFPTTLCWPWTWSRTLSRSSGAVHVLETTPASPPHRIFFR